MDSGKMGIFILESRKKKQMTQKDLAELLHITDKAVSKWERGLSYPDISLLPRLAEVLGVNTNELLNGENDNIDNENFQVKVETGIDKALQYAGKHSWHRFQSLQRICTLIITIGLLLSILICTICDYALTKNLTWSLYANSAIVFAWLLLFPLLKLGKKGLLGSMLSLSIIIIPFLAVLNLAMKQNDVWIPKFLQIGIAMAIIGIFSIWIAYWVIKKFSHRKLLATAFVILLMIPLDIIISFTLSIMLPTDFLNLWDVFGFAVIGVLAILCFVVDYSLMRRDS